MSIPISQIVKVTPSVLAAAGSALDLNGVVVSNAGIVPNGMLAQFASADDVGAYFGIDTPEYRMAVVYFLGMDKGTLTPALLYFVNYNAAVASAYLRGGSLAGMTLTQLKALTGTLAITDDGTVNTSSSINLSAATSFANAAALIEAAFTTPTFAVTYDALHNAFVFTSGTTGLTSTMAYAGGTLAASLKLQAAQSATISLGAAVSTPGGTMDGVKALSQNWGTFGTAFEPITSDKLLFAQWNNAQGRRFAYAVWDTDPNALVAGNTTTFMYEVNLANIDGVIAMGGADVTEEHAAFVMSYAASLNFNQLNGRQTLAFQTQDGLIPSVDNLPDATALIANGYNYYGAYAGAKANFVCSYPGSVSGEFDWADSYVNQIWLNANIQLAAFQLLMSIGAIPYNSAGNALIDAAVTDPAQAAVNFGAIVPGVTLSASQIAQLRNAVGLDISGPLFATGWYLAIGIASPAVRVARGSPPMTFYYTDGGSVQSLDFASIEIQ